MRVVYVYSMQNNQEACNALTIYQESKNFNVFNPSLKLIVFCK